MSTVNNDEDFQVWINLIHDNLPDIATLRHLIERQDTTIQIVINGNTENVNRFAEHLERFITIDNNELHDFIKEDDRRYMILEPEIEPLRQDPFWAQQGKRTKGKRGRY